MKLLNTLCALSIVAFAGCQMESSEEGLGKASFKLTDAPVTNAENVFLTLSSITLKGPNGQVSYEFTNDDNEPEPLVVDLLSLTGATAVSLIEDWTLPAGEYQWIRLTVETDGVDDTYLILNDDGGGHHELTVPSGELKLNRGFTVPANGSVDFTLDVDLSKSLVLANGNYKLKPVIRLIDNADAGHIDGTVETTTFTDNSCDSIAVYAFEGADATAEDIYITADINEGPELLAWVDTSTTPYSYELGFLTTGDYTLHLACFGVDESDDPEVDDDVDFIADIEQNVTVENGATKKIDF